MSQLAFRYARKADAPALVDLIERAYRGPEAAGKWTSEASLLTGPRTNLDEIITLIDREDSPALGMHPAWQMKAGSDRRVIQPTIKELLESRQRGIATGLMPFATTAEATFKFLR